MSEKPNFQYLDKINGKRIINFIIKGKLFSELNTNFEIDISKGCFTINSKSIMDDLVSFDIEKLEYLYCIDENEIPFTIYDCCISPIISKYVNIMITWNDILYGALIENIKNKNVEKITCILENSKLPYSTSIGTSEYLIESQTICVKTSRYCKRKI